MDLGRLDHLARSLVSAPSRRRLLGVLAAAPLLGGVLDILNPGEADAKDRRRRRKQRHKRRKSPGKRKRADRRERQDRRKRKNQRTPECQPRSTAQVCAGLCGLVTSSETCGTTVDCGSCACEPPCGACLTCQSGPNTSGACVPDPAQNGNACDDGAPCTMGNVCQAGVCGGGTPVVCPATDCEIAGVCNPATGACTAPGFKSPGDLCASQPCGACNGLGGCVANAACSGTTPVCDGTSCVACSATHPCPSGCCDEATGACVPDCPACHTCEGDVCAPVQDGECCGPGQQCAAGVCATVEVASLAACNGQCDCDENCSGSPVRAKAEVCGVEVSCPPCNACLDYGCSANFFVNEGPNGFGYYCFGGATSEYCSGFACPTPETYCGQLNGRCYPLCTGA